MLCHKMRRLKSEEEGLVKQIWSRLNQEERTIGGTTKFTARIGSEGKVHFEPHATAEASQGHNGQQSASSLV